MKSKKWKLQPLSKGTSGGGTGKIASNIHRPPSAAAVAQRQVFLCRREKQIPLSSDPFNPLSIFKLLKNCDFAFSPADKVNRHMKTEPIEQQGTDAMFSRENIP